MGPPPVGRVQAREQNHPGFGHEEGKPPSGRQVREAGQSVLVLG